MEIHGLPKIDWIRPLAAPAIDDARARRAAEALCPPREGSRRSATLGLLLATFCAFGLHALGPSGSLSTRAVGARAGSPSVESGDQEMQRMRSLVAGAVGVGMMTTGAAGQQAVQWRVEDGGNGHWYAIAANPMGDVHWTFAAAAAYAQARGAHLVTFASQSENAAVYNLLQLGSGSFSGWIGLAQTPGSAEPAGGWGWITGEPMTFSSWQPGEPNNSGCYQSSAAQNWATLEGSQAGGSTQGSWDDDGDPVPACMSEVRRAVIEFDADCNNDGIVDYGQILSGQLADTNQTGVPDICEVPPCPADVTGNGSVNSVDLAVVLSAWGTDGQTKFDADIDDNGVVDSADLGAVLSGWGECP